MLYTHIKRLSGRCAVNLFELPNINFGEKFVRPPAAAHESNCLLSVSLSLVILIFDVCHYHYC